MNCCTSQFSAAAVVLASLTSSKDFPAPTSGEDGEGLLYLCHYALHSKIKFVTSHPGLNPRARCTTQKMLNVPDNAQGDGSYLFPPARGCCRPYAGTTPTHSGRDSTERAPKGPLAVHRRTGAHVQFTPGSLQLSLGGCRLQFDIKTAKIQLCFRIFVRKQHRLH